MKQNVGDLDAYLRLVGGFTLLGHGIMRNSEKSVFLGAIKIAEGVTRWCPMLALMGKTTIHDDEKCLFKHCHEDTVADEV